jgi:hypothetical protein
MHLAPKDVLVTIEVNLIDGLNTNKIETVIDNIVMKGSVETTEYHDKIGESVDIICYTSE